MLAVAAHAVHILAQIPEVKTSPTDMLVRGLFAFGLALTLLVGSIWLLLSMILGARLAYWITGSVLFASLVLLSATWSVTSIGLGGSTQRVALGPKGPDTIWHAVAVGPKLDKIKLGSITANSKITGAPQERKIDDTYAVGDYPAGSEWKVPAVKQYLADLSGIDDTLSEQASAAPVLKELVSSALSFDTLAPETQAIVKNQILGPVGLQSGQFDLADIRFKQEKVNGRDSIIAMGTAVPSHKASAPAGIAEGSVTKVLAKIGDRLTLGTPILTAKDDKGNEFQVDSDGNGRLLSLAVDKGSKVKAGATVAVLDVTGQPGAPSPVQVSAARIRGSLRTPALAFLFLFTILFLIHMAGLSRVESSRRTAVAPQEA